MIVWRNQRGEIGAFLNTCLHSTNKVCLYDSGRAASLTCSYHGWTYDTEGKLIGVPYLENAYYGDLDMEQWGLVKVPRLQNYGGLLFGCWDPAVTSSALCGLVSQPEPRASLSRTCCAPSWKMNVRRSGSTLLFVPQRTGRRPFAESSASRGARRTSVFEPVDLRELVEDVVRATAPKWRDEPERNDKPIDLLVDAPTELWCNGIAAELREALTNIMLNAVQLTSRHRSDLYGFSWWTTSRCLPSSYVRFSHWTDTRLRCVRGKRRSRR